MSHGATVTQASAIRCAVFARLTIVHVERGVIYADTQTLFAGRKSVYGGFCSSSKKKFTDSANWMKKANRFQLTASITSPPCGGRGQPAALNRRSRLTITPIAIWIQTRKDTGI